MKRLLGVGLACLIGLSVGGWSFVLRVEAPAVLSISEGGDAGPLILPFGDFVEGSVTDSRNVTYHVRANQMTRGSFPGAIRARLSDRFENVRLEASAAGYQNKGKADFSSLTSSTSGFTEIGTQDVSLADKQPGQGHLDQCLDGQWTVTWRAILTQDSEAGSQTRSLIVTLRDGY